MKSILKIQKLACTRQTPRKCAYRDKITVVICRMISAVFRELHWVLSMAVSILIYCWPGFLSHRKRRWVRGAHRGAHGESDAQVAPTTRDLPGRYHPRDCGVWRWFLRVSRYSLFFPWFWFKRWGNGFFFFFFFWNPGAMGPLSVVIPIDKFHSRQAKATPGTRARFQMLARYG